jgi:hypothetical protein
LYKVPCHTSCSGTHSKSEFVTFPVVPLAGFGRATNI